MRERRIVDVTLAALVGAETEEAVHRALVGPIHELLPESFVMTATLVPGTDDFRATA